VKGKYLAITTDHWSSCAQHSYLAVTAHLIDSEWKLQKFVLACNHYEGENDSGETVARLVRQIWQEYDIEEDMIVSCVSDSAPNMNTFGQLLTSPHDYCTDHIRELAPKQLCSKSRRVADVPVAVKQLLAKSTRIVTETHSSPQSSEAFELLQQQQYPEREPLKLIKDVKTRWWTTFSMFQRMLLLQDAIALAPYRGIIQQSLEPHEWKLMEALVKCYRPFEKAQRQLEGEKHVTASLVLGRVRDLHRVLTEQAATCEVADARDMLELMRLDFIHRWGDFAAGSVWHTSGHRGELHRQVGIAKNFLLASALDPRTKQLIGMDDADRNHVRNRLSELLIPLVIVPNAAPNSKGVMVSNAAIDDDNEDAIFQQQGVAMDEVVFDPVQMINDELGNYFAMPFLRWTVDGEHTCPLQWWKQRELLFPHLAQLAKRYLCVPASSESSERASATAGLTIAHHAANLILLKAAIDDEANFGDIL
jgi:hypothetical protein